MPEETKGREKDKEESGWQNLVRGAGTGVPLGDVTPLLLPWARGPWGALRPPVSVEAMRLSAELAAATYHMDIEPWVQAVAGCDHPGGQ